MSTRRPPHASAITLTVSALLGLGLLAGCTSGGGGSAPPKASASAAAPRSSATPAGLSPAAMSAAALLSAARAALTAGGSVHVDITAKGQNSLVAFSDDDTASGGRQVITVDGTGRATILLINGVDYVQADAATLQGFFHASQQVTEQAAGRWISLRPGDTLGASTYDDVTAGITLSSVAQELQLAGHLTKAAPATLAGQPVIGVQAPVPASDGLPGAKMVLYVTDNAALRPVRYELVGGGSVTNELSFSRWGEKLTLTRPANAIPASSLTSGTTLT